MVDALRKGDPSRMGPYRLEGRLGGGGMGEVFLGRSPGGRPVAVKAVRPELAGDTGFRRRFATEVEAARQVGGFYTAQVVDADPGGDPPWLATAYIPGPSLQEAVEAYGPLPVAAVAALGAGLAEGLAAVHAGRLVHRDVKPANVILAEDGPRLIDFGIARALDGASQTRTRTVIGTAGFMSPEQARGREVGPASDVFSLGCVLAFAATGRSPFGTGLPDAVAYRIVHEKPDLSGVPGGLSGLLSSCLAKKPGRRPGLDEVLRRLTPPPGKAPAHAGGRWLPAEITEVIEERKTRVLPPERSSAAGARKSGTGKAEETGKGAGGGGSSGSGGPSGEWGFYLAAAGMIVAGLYLSSSPFALFVSEWLNDGTEEIAEDDCMAFAGDSVIPVEVPCFSAAAQYTVAALRPPATESPESEPLFETPPVPADACAEVAGWSTGADLAVEIGGEIVCLVGKEG
ncbi:serine/threonine-protein kinase [Nocardiopsis sp. CNT-189]|uniref:serine/threonine-protein kinase n=1 Tax=Nocardiopsis oceanisediminis TaxID=2816862 RepID=UPI003B3AC9B2